ncbi:response regulator PleD [Sphingomonas sp. Leaf33]|uniref:putative bifunctional diguanylate cyclase/phosphodiesterase n=1 Tax=Sphingomonas sp. Leaf33 TaxID=1736215 RepID=UPI0006FDFDEC|nr:EAL domain-containing protein [Sphingomonas sp. Leaf33]KQN19519.1 response regulator PleD [Sphingomonas sp. Leaf33]
MASTSLINRAGFYAIGAGAMAFVLTLLAMGHGFSDGRGMTHAAIAGVVCATLCWFSVYRSLNTSAAALDAAIDRLVAAAKGDLEADVPMVVVTHAPPLAHAMADLFQQLHTHIDGVQRLALFDPVTGLPNRTHFRRAVECQLIDLPLDARAALFFIDLDRFKRVNDTLGHAVGDQLLAMVANRLRVVAERFVGEGEASRPLIGRLSGDEFTIFYPRLTRVGDADRIARGVLFALTEPFDLANQDVTIGASIGIALRPDHGETLTELMRAADTAMYHAKATGRGRAEQFSDRLAEELADRAQLECDLRDALDREQFGLVFQPQVGLADRRVVAAEALLRWRHPSGEERLPGAFLHRAEESGLIVEIGEWVIGSVAATIRRWGAIGVDHRLAVNVSQRELDHAQFFHRLRDAMRSAGAPASLLELEITETMAMRCSAEVVEAIAALRADGATIAIDDFGTGYSNLARLRTLPIDRIKLDRSVIATVTEGPEALAIVQSLVGLIHGLGLEAVAEGVERLDQADVLRIIGCDVIQGYAVAEPMAEAAFLTWSRAEIDRVRLTA